MAQGMEYTSPLNDREHLDKPKSQIGFYTFVCLPLYQTTTRLASELLVNEQQVQSNLVIWKKEEQEKIEAEEKEKEKEKEEKKEKEEDVNEGNEGNVEGIEEDKKEIDDGTNGEKVEEKNDE